mmetsp:Transcript_18514/g.42844  ORF Transcript_18514/g.42844 Transcript_18514/m.42844 type:complete len:235 (-) Transcript_18514:62-766(-)
MLKMCTVPRMLLHERRVEVGLKDRELIWAACAPLLTSCKGLPECVSKTRSMVPFSLAVTSRDPSRFSARQDRCDACASILLVLRASKSSTRTWPLWLPGHARTVWCEEGDRAQRPLRFETVSISWVQTRSLNLYTSTLYSITTTTLSLRRRTLLTSCRNDNSPMSFRRWSSQMITLFGGKRPLFAAPTRAKMLHLKSISTCRIPPPSSSLLKVSLKGEQLYTRKPVRHPTAKQL